MSDAILSDAERSRATRFRDPAAAARYVATRTLVRRVLGDKLGIAAHEVPITQTDLGKPVTTGGLHFNVSHSGDLVVLAVSVDAPVGIDIERRRHVPRTAALIDRWLTATERRDVRSRVERGASESDAFLQVWSLKEARLKALGVGLAGANSVATASTDAVPLDELLGGLRDRSTAAEYVGAVAFA